MSDRFKMIPDYTVRRRVTILSETMDYNHAMMNVPHMWRKTEGAGIKVAILDTGVPAHIDLEPKKGASMLDGYLEDKNGHSTHVGGIIAAKAHNGMGVAGIAPQCEDLYCAVLDQQGSGTVNSIIDGVRWAMDEGVDVINMSLGLAVSRTQRALEAVCDAAANQGIAIFAATGNDYGVVNQPARYDSVIAVAAVDSAKSHADFSSHGKQVEFAAGGVDVFSTYLRNSYAVLSGTSMACPALVGVATLILADAKQEGVILTPDELRAKLRKIAFDVDADGRDDMVGHGIPIFGPHTDIPAPPPPPPPDNGGGKAKPWGMGPAANCAYWRMFNRFVEGFNSVGPTTSTGAALRAGMAAVGAEAEVVNRALKKS